jgi:hypothetical protein
MGFPVRPAQASSSMSVSIAQLALHLARENSFPQTGGVDDAASPTK